MTRGLKEVGAAVYDFGWDLKRRFYASGLRRQERVNARVVSVGNLTMGGTGKTTLVLHLARLAAARGLDAAVVCRRYRPGPTGRGDEEKLLEQALGARRVYAGRSKRSLAVRAAAAGHGWILVDDGFSHWGLARDLDVVLLDAGDPFGGGRVLPAGRMREPLRALQRADVVVLTRVPLAEDWRTRLAAIGRVAPGALLAAARHRPAAVHALDGAALQPRGPAHVVTATGNPSAVAASAAEAGFAPVTLAAYRDHHWFSEREAGAERERAGAQGARIVLTAKDAVRWPDAHAAGVAVLETEWQWLEGGEEVERRVFAGEKA